MSIMKENKRASDFTNEEKLAIIERARKIGNEKTAREFGTTRWTVRNIRYYNKPVIPQTAKYNSSTTTQNLSPEVPKMERKLSAAETENAILKEKISILNDEIEKLKKVVSMLA